MQRTIDIARQILVIALPLSLFMAIVLLVRSSYFLENKALSLPVSIDLLLSIPFLYFLSIRRTKIPNITVVPVMVIGLTLGMYILPKEEQFYLEVFKQWVLPLIEVGVLVYIVGKVRSLIKRYRLQKEVQPDFYQALSTVCAGLFPGRIGILFATEISMIYYGIIRWNISPLQEHQYSYHKKSGAPSLLLGFVLVVGIEAAAIHKLAAKWSVSLAWILTALSIYAVLQLIGFAKSLAHRPIEIGKEQLFLRFGIMGEAVVLLKHIDRVEISSKDLSDNKEILRLSPLGVFDSHNIIVYLNQKQVISGLYGIKKHGNAIALHIDSPEVFKKHLDMVVQQRHTI